MIMMGGPGNKTQRSFVLWFFLIGFATCVFAQGRGRLVRVRKTGEFGRRITPISTSYQPPPRETSGSDPYFQTAETRRSGANVVLGIKKPSQSLQLPIYTPPDQEAEESAENVQGYAYPDPNSPEPSNYNQNNQKPPILEFPQQEVDEPGQNLDEAPVPVQPERVAELPPRGNRPVPLQAEAEEMIGAEEVGAPRKAPVPVRDSPSAESGSSDCAENDHSCWPGGYKSEIPGDAGTDYPILSEIVDTSFDCDNVQYSGYYADTDDASRCQMFHVCLKGNAYRKTQKWSFLCPNGTVFSQNDFVCVWWNAAPECTSSIIGELSLRNEELGWDNLTEADQQRGTAGFDVNSAMSSLANANLQPSSSNSRLKNTLPEESNSRRSGQRVRQGNGNPYRVPVKVDTGAGARTKLKEVSHNSLQGSDGNSDLYGGVEHFGEESETFETSLRHQSEARRKTKSGSALAKSESEAYEQKSVSDSVSPFIVTRGNPTGNSNEDYSDEHEGTSPGVVMMASQQRNPDGSEGIAQVPVRIQEEGYRYPNPNSTPGPAYLPPRKDYRTTTTSSNTETPTSTLIPEENSDVQAQGGYDYQTPEYSQQLLQQPEDSISTTEESGYRYPAPTTTEKATEGGYNYDAPSTTTEQSAEYNNVEDTSEGTTEGGYNTNNNLNSNYETPSTTEQEEGYRYPQPSTTESSTGGVTEEQYSVNSKPVFEEDRMNAGYAYEPSTTYSPRDPTTTTFRTTEEAGADALGSLEATTVGNEGAAGGYLPPKEGGYSASQVHQRDPEVLALPNGGDDDNKDALGGSDEVSSSGEDLSTDGPISGGYGGGSNAEEATTGQNNNNNIPTPSSNLPGGSHLDSSPPASSPAERKGVNDILEQIKAGGAEVRDENGNKIDFEQLQKLILSTPNGQLALQKADDTEVTTVASSGPEGSEATEVTPTESEGTEGGNGNTEVPSGGYEEPQQEISKSPVVAAVAASPTLETVQPIQDYIVNNNQQNRIAPTIQQGYSSGQPQESYFTNNRLVSSKHGSFEISAPSKEYENHSVEQNSIDNPATITSGGVRNSFESGFTSSAPYESQRLSNQVQSQGFINNQQNNNNLPFQSQQGGFISSVRPSVPQPEQYYTPTQSQVSSNTNGYFQQQQQSQTPSFQSSIPTQQSQYFQSQPQQPSYFNSPNQYLPPPVSSTRSNNIQLQQSYNVPIPQASSINRKLVNPGDIKIVPALFVHQHTRVENPDGSPVASASNSNFQKTSSTGRNAYPEPSERFNGHYNIQSSRSAYIPYASQNVPVRVKAPRLHGFTRRDVLNAPNKNSEQTAVESFTLEDGRVETRKYQNQRLNAEDNLAAQSSIRRHRRRTSRGRIGASGPRGQKLEEVTTKSKNDLTSLSNVYLGNDNLRRSQGVHRQSN